MCLESLLQPKPGGLCLENKQKVSMSSQLSPHRVGAQSSGTKGTLAGPQHLLLGEIWLRHKSLCGKRKSPCVVRKGVLAARATVRVGDLLFAVC